MAAKRSHRIGSNGQATIETALALPFLIWLIFYTLNAFHTIHTSHVAQRFAAMNLAQRMQNRAKFIMDDKDNQLHNRGFMAVRYMDPEGKPVVRKILFGPTQIISIVGVCREPGCN